MFICLTQLLIKTSLGVSSRGWILEQRTFRLDCNALFAMPPDDLRIKTKKIQLNLLTARNYGLACSLSQKNEDFVRTIEKLLKPRYWSFPALCQFT